MKHSEKQISAVHGNILNNRLTLFEQKVQFVKQRVAFESTPEYQLLLQEVVNSQRAYDEMLDTARSDRLVQIAQYRNLEQEHKDLGRQLKSIEAAYMANGLRSHLFEFFWSLGLRRLADRILPLYTTTWQSIKVRSQMSEIETKNSSDDITFKSRLKLSTSTTELHKSEIKWLFGNRDRVLMKAIIDYRTNYQEAFRLFSQYELVSGIDARGMYNEYKKAISPEYKFDSTIREIEESSKSFDITDQFKSEPLLPSDNEKVAQRSALIHARGGLVSYAELGHEGFSKIVRMSKTPISESVLRTKIEWLCSLDREEIVQLFGRFGMVNGNFFDGYLKIKVGGNGRILVKFGESSEGKEVYIQFGEYSKVYKN